VKASHQKVVSDRKESHIKTGTKETSFSPRTSTILPLDYATIGVHALLITGQNVGPNLQKIKHRSSKNPAEYL
jgi:hypothetical protein